MQTRYMGRSNSMAREKRALDPSSTDEGQRDPKRTALARHWRGFLNYQRTKNVLSHLYLNINNLSGNIPPELGNMASLQGANVCLAQLLGTTLACLTLRVLFYDQAVDMRPTVTQYSSSTTDLQAIIWEFIISFFLMFTISGAASDHRAVLDAELAILDEIDSGLDIDAVQDVVKALNGLLTPKNFVLMITHYHCLLEFIKPNYVHIMDVIKVSLDSSCLPIVQLAEGLLISNDLLCEIDGVLIGPEYCKVSVLKAKNLLVWKHHPQV